ncbi:hypothetical protein EZ456_18705 [Pedobacter psychrodurus]|uniref:Uncharacterized protein n=1 Tax=Pedobacter psychrodurus TaxID=2530456 RepID=A0A4R0PRW2_9SPHI|nr:hypothetical protein [Pedobacter psychrodurus]TCD21797.1 hypothetical protein EZ456_18705 [Pedobacter psychrodurus]
MRRFFSILILIVLTSCQENNSTFVFDPSVPYPLLNPGDFWLDKFDQRGLQHATIYQDRIYCNTINIGGDNFLYCLNPKNGLVEWRGSIDAFATQSASFINDRVVYCSYLGNISTFNKQGKVIWKAKFNHPYGGHCLDTINSKVLVKTVYWKNVSEYDLKSGKLISDNENDSLTKLIEKNVDQKRFLEKHEYRFKRNGKTYTIKSRPSRSDEVIIKIEYN